MFVLVGAGVAPKQAVLAADLHGVHGDLEAFSFGRRVVSTEPFIAGAEAMTAPDFSHAVRRSPADSRERLQVPGGVRDRPRSARSTARRWSRSVSSSRLEFVGNRHASVVSVLSNAAVLAPAAYGLNKMTLPPCTSSLTDISLATADFNRDGLLDVVTRGGANTGESYGVVVMLTGQASVVLPGSSLFADCRPACRSTRGTHGGCPCRSGST